MRYGIWSWIMPFIGVLLYMIILPFLGPEVQFIFAGILLVGNPVVGLIFGIKAIKLHIKVNPKLAVFLSAILVFLVALTFLYFFSLVLGAAVLILGIFYEIKLSKRLGKDPVLASKVNAISATVFNLIMLFIGFVTMISAAIGG